MDRGLIVQKNLATKARDNRQNEYKVTLTMYRYGPGLVMGAQTLDFKWTLRIEDCPGGWYMSTLLEGGYPRGRRIAIDDGRNWYCENFDAVMAEAITLI